MKTGYSEKIIILLLFSLFCATCLALIEIRKTEDIKLAQKNAPTFLFDLEEQYYPCDYSEYYYDKNGNEIDPKQAVEKYLEDWGQEKHSKIFYSISQKNDKTIIQYWLFYVFNDFLNKHYGDAETITVIIDSEKNEKTVIGSAHIGNVSKIALANNQITQDIDSPTNILVELGSHANYPDKNGNSLPEARELDNWYNAYGISNWDEYDKKGIKLSKNEYELLPLSLLEEKLKGKEQLKNTKDLGWEINLKGDFLGYDFDKIFYLPFGGKTTDLSSIQPLKNEPIIAMPISLGKGFGKMTDLMIKNYSTQNPYRSDISEFFLEEKNLEITKDDKNSKESRESQTTEKNIDQEKQKLLEENEKLKKAIYEISIQVAKLQNQVDQLSAKKTIGKVKGAKTEDSYSGQIKIIEIASGVNNASEEYIQIYNSGKEDINLEKNFSFYIISGNKKTKKQINWINPLIKPGTFALLSDKSLSQKTNANGYYSAGIPQNFEILIEYQGENDFVSFSSQKLNTGYCAKREKTGNNYIDSFSISQECLIKPDKENKSENTLQSTQGNGSSQTPKNDNPVFYPILINEIMYDPQGKESGREWIEIYNNSQEYVDLTNWKLFENNTNHSLTLEQGNIKLSPFDYAVIIQDKQEFLKDYPEFNGTILKSSFSLSENEIIAIKNKDLEIDKIEYSQNYGAKGNGYSLQLIDGKWQESIPNPGKENIKKYHDLIANFSIASQDQIIGENIYFDASSSQVINEISSFNWMIASTTINSTSSILNYVFNATGTYEISLTVSNKYFSTSSPTTTIVQIVEKNQTLNDNHFSTSSIIINEIMYDPQGSDDGNEWIEIRNNSNQSINLENWKLFEDNTNHKITPEIGTSTIQQNEFAIISNNAQKFLERYPDFTGIVLKSSFALSNNSELLAIKYNDAIIDQYSYASFTGASGNSNSLQLISNIWQEACPTPGQENTAGLCQIQTEPALTTYSDLTPEQFNSFNSQDTSSTEELPIIPTSTLPQESIDQSTSNPTQESTSTPV